MPESVLRQLERRVQQRALSADPGQRRLAERLDRLARELDGYAARPAPAGWRKLLSEPRRPPRGLYIHGDVGRGKTMLMDLLIEAVENASKRRAHFHAFMRDVHARIHAIRQQQRTGHVWDDADPIAMVAGQVAGESALLCLDEFQVADIADAMILGRLFEALLRNGAVIVTTSNARPSDLYRNGLNRDAFLPFIALIEQRFDVFAMDEGRDYRRDRLKGEPVYLTPLGPEADRAVDRLWMALTDSEHGAPASIPVLGRSIVLPEACRGVARLSFADLCAKALGSPDYLAIAETFHTLILEHVPILSRDRHNEARRLVTLIDTLYDRGTRLIVSAAAPPEAVYPAGEGDTAFRRTASRLNEMQSAEYWEAASRKAAE